MPLTRRYTPEIHPGESCVIGMSYEYVIPPGVGIATGEVFAFFNQQTQAGAVPSSILFLGPVSIRGRILACDIIAQPEANALDFQIQWIATDTNGDVWPRTALLLCSVTS